MIHTPSSLKIIHDNAGFFSCSSVRLDNIVRYFNHYKYLPPILDTSPLYTMYKPLDRNNRDQDITHEYFITTGDEIKYVGDILYDMTYQYLDYKTLDYEKICPFVRKYFSPTQKIRDIIRGVEKQYSLDYKNICVLFYRGNDKETETPICGYNDFIVRAREIQKATPQIRFLIQSDETEFINTMTAEFPTNSFYFNNMIRHMYKCATNSVDKVFPNSNYTYSKYFLAITIIMSKCKHVLCMTGNCSLWIALYRENAHNFQQFMNTTWV